jgi:hypothetical protein
MSDPNINIKITTAADTSGADAASAAIGKVTASTEADAAASKADLEALEKKAEAYREAADAAKRNADEQQSLADAARAEEQAERVAQIARRQKLDQMRNIGADMGRLGDVLKKTAGEVAKFDPQLAATIGTMGEMGQAVGKITGAMASGAMVGGPWGAAIAGAGAAAGMAAKEFIQSSVDIAAASARVDEMVKKQAAAFRDLGAAQGEARFKDFISGFDDTSAAMDRNNKVLEENLRLQRALKDIALSEAESDASRRKAEIDASDASPAEKAAQKAAIDQELSGKKATRDVEKIEEGASDAERAAADAVERQRLIQEELAAVQREKEDAAAKVAEFEEQEKRRKDAAEKAEVTRGAIAGRGGIGSAVGRFFNPKNLGRPDKAIADAFDNDTQAALLLRLTEQENAAQGPGAKAEGEYGSAKRFLAEANAKEAELLKQEQEARDRANDLGRTAETTRAIAERQKEARGLQFGNETAARNVTVEAREREEQRKREKEQNRRDLEEERERRKAELDSSARSGFGDFDAAGRKVGGALGKSLSGIGSRLSDGTNESELAQLTAQFEAATKGMGGATISALSAMLAAQQKQALEISALEARIKNLP